MDQQLSRRGRTQQKSWTIQRRRTIHAHTRDRTVKITTIKYEMLTWLNYDNTLHGLVRQLSIFQEQKIVDK